MKNYFLDTNVLLDFLLEREPFVGPATQLVELAVSGQLRLTASSLSFTTVYYLMRRQRVSEAAVISALTSLARVVTIAPVTAEMIQQALRSGLPDFEDAVQFFAALAAGAEAIVTRDRKGFPTQQVPVLSPLAALAQL